MHISCVSYWLDARVKFTCEIFVSYIHTHTKRYVLTYYKINNKHRWFLRAFTHRILNNTTKNRQSGAVMKKTSTKGSGLLLENPLQSACKLYFPWTTEGYKLSPILLSVIGQNAPQVLMANMSLTPLQSTGAAQSAASPHPDAHSRRCRRQKQSCFTSGTFPGSVL